MTIRVVTEIAELAAELATRRQRGASVGYVPTMGYLHAGHVSLFDTSVENNDTTVASIFVNPLQFAPGEDFEAYPRDPDGDRFAAEAAGVDLLFVPSVEEMYPNPVLTRITVSGVSSTMEGAARPVHFSGVATVVAKLFSIVGPSTAYFGEKDFQQLAVIRRMASDLSLPTRVVGCPTVRESDGLAMSSRNVYLTAGERAAAPVLHRALQAGADLVREGETDADRVRDAIATMIRDTDSGVCDYVEVAQRETLESQSRSGPDSRLFGAIRFSRARLIDNVGVDVGAAS